MSKRAILFCIGIGLAVIGLVVFALFRPGRMRATTTGPRTPNVFTSTPKAHTTPAIKASPKNLAAATPLISPEQRTLTEPHSPGGIAPPGGVLPKAAPAVTPVFFTVGDLTLPFEMADSEDSTEFRTEALQDIKRIFKYFTGYETMHARSLPTLTIRRQQVSAYKRVNFTGPGRYRPKQIASSFGYVGEVDERDAILIPEEILAAYRDASTRRRQNPKVYDSFFRLVDRLNNLTSQPNVNADRFGLFDLSSGTSSDESTVTSKQQLVSALGDCTYRAPSLLDISPAPEGSSTLKDKFVAKVFRFDKEGKWSELDVVYDRGDWKLIVGG